MTALNDNIVGQRNNFPQLDFANEAEAIAYQHEMTELAGEIFFDQLLQPKLGKYLLAILRREEGEKGIMATQLATLLSPEEPALLLNFFYDICTKAHLPRRSEALVCLLRLCIRFSDTVLLAALVPVLNDLNYAALQKVTQATQADVRLIAELFEHCSTETEQAKGQSALELPILELLITVICDEGLTDAVHEATAGDLLLFYREVFPEFVRLLQVTGITMHDQLTTANRLAAWFSVWWRHRARQEQSIGGSRYYALDFATIIRYVPTHLWWNDGCPGPRGQQIFTYGSAEFIHLACGGSIRKLPNSLPYTRRMARAFVTLVGTDELAGQEIYYYCFAKSLGAGPKLLRLLPRFLRRPASKKQIPEQLRRWDPIIQKLSTPYVEQLSDFSITRLLGYCFHLLRDQADFRATHISPTELMGLANRYYEQIEHRREQRVAAARAQQLAAKKEAERPKVWTACIEISGYQVNAKRTSTFRRIKITELLSKTALEAEGRAMRHCVGSYVSVCMKGHTRIWSLQGLNPRNQWERIATIEIQRSHKRIVQIRGRFNSLVEADQLAYIRSWAKAEGLTIGC